LVVVVGSATCFVVEVEVEVLVGLGAGSVAGFLVDVVVGLAWVLEVGFGAVVVGFSGSLDEDPDADEEEEEDEEPGALEYCEVFGELVDEGADAVVDAELDGDDEPESPLPSPRDLTMLSINPSFAYACVTSHIMTPPKLSNFFEYSITSASLSAGMYPVLAAVV
jgi:hypothetical protein